MAWMLLYCAGVTASLYALDALPQITGNDCLLIAAFIFLIWALFYLCGVQSRHIKQMLVWATGFFAGGLWAILQANTALLQTIPEITGRYDYQLTGTIVGSISRKEINSSYGKQVHQQRLQFLFDVESINPLFECNSAAAKLACKIQPKRLQLTLFEEASLKSGQRWKLKARLSADRPLGNPDSFDSAKYALSEGISGRGYVRAFTETATRQLTRTQQTAHQHLYLAIRNDRIQQLEPLWSSLVHGDVLQALILGERAALPANTKKLFNDTGTSHLMAISGLHISVAAGFGFLIGRLIYALLPARLLVLPRFYLAAMCACSSALFYACLAGFTLSTQRAVIMIAAAFLAKALYRYCGTAHLLALAAFTLLLIDPLAVLSNGFWLSFGAVAILLISNSFYQVSSDKNQNSGLVQWLKTLLHAQKSLFFAMPLILSMLGMKASFIAPLANLFAIPVFSFAVIPLSLLALLLSYISIDLAYYILKIPDGLLQALLYLLKLLENQWPMSTTFRSSMNPVEFALGIFAVVILLGRLRLPGYALALLLWALLFSPIIDKSNYRSRTLAEGDFTLTQLDVGQGTAVLINTQNQTWLYDTGASSPSGFSMAEAVILPVLNHYGISQIDTLIISHADNDHAGGLQILLDSVPVGRVLHGPNVNLDHASAQTCVAGDYWQVDGVEFRFLHPEQGAWPHSSNDTSCVLQIIEPHVHAAKAQVLISGDISRKVERRLLDLHEQLTSELLIAPHHGSNSSSSALFIDAVSPDYALVSSGFNNHYGHPHAKVLQRYASENVPVLRSDSLGAIQWVYRNDALHGPYCYRYEARYFWQRYNNKDICKAGLQRRL